MIRILTLICIALGFATCKMAKQDSKADIDQVAANAEVAAALRKFEGRGALTDASQPTPATQALKEFIYPDDLSMELVLSEPQISQPLFMNFDHRGRLWVVQYQQYPYPKGLKVMSIDEHLRIKFDKMPEAPPGGIKGADKITVFEDTDGDGKFDKATDAITGLNIATSVVLGRKKIWVLNPPYLIAFPDKNEDGIPDGKPEVHLSGFGLEDTHAVANSLRWGPDGWLYGAQGSTTTAVISSKASKNVAFKGQVIWRYHPENHQFEVFAEGGGNTFYVEIDDKGRIFSGDNGYSRGMYYKQGGYYPRNLDKHGPYTNPYTFGRLPNMPLEGENKRFTHAWLKYQGGDLPSKYNDKIIAINPLQSYLQLTRFEKNGSSFKNVDEEIILRTKDRWFRPVDIKTGPDGAIYLADWYDSRLSHVDARDTWHKTSGRIYRIKSKDAESNFTKFDLSGYTSDQLITLLSHSNRWFREQALQVIGDRKDQKILPKLNSLLLGNDGQLALEALWAINLTGGFDENMMRIGLGHSDPFVRMWTVRLIGDGKAVSDDIGELLKKMAIEEKHPEVRSQLVSSVRRLQGDIALAILTNMLKNNSDSSDPDIPMLMWWALESKVDTDKQKILALFDQTEIRDNSIVGELLSRNLSRRLILSGTAKDLQFCTELLQKVRIRKEGYSVIKGIQEGLSGNNSTLPQILIDALKPFQQEYQLEVLSILVRQQEVSAVDEALKLIVGTRINQNERIMLMNVLGEAKEPRSIDVFLSLLSNSTAEVKKVALQALQYFQSDLISQTIIKNFSVFFSEDIEFRTAAMQLLLSRTSWSNQLMDAIQEGKYIDKNSVPDAIIQRLVVSNDMNIAGKASKLWPSKTNSVAKLQRIEEVTKVLKSGEGNKENGKLLFTNHCGSCHRLFKEGGNIGPDLTGYDRRNLSDIIMNTVDPGAEIREGYVLYQVETKDGRILGGKLIGQNGNNYVIQLLTGDEVTIPENQIVKMEAQTVSLMPEGLLDGLKDQEIRDLFAYISLLD